MKNNGMSRYTGRVNLDQKLSKYAKVGINLTVSRNTLDNVPLGAGQNEYASILVSQLSLVLYFRSKMKMVITV